MCLVAELKSGLPELKFDLPEAKFGLPLAKFGFREAKFGFPEVKFDLPEAKINVCGQFLPRKLLPCRLAHPYETNPNIHQNVSKMFQHSARLKT